MKIIIKRGTKEVTTCKNCGMGNPLVKNLSVREWECPFCHTKHDRDYNASINILNKGLSLA